ncbi:MAG: SpoIIE family protein phosphatase [Deltaproteobacteria bacterium]|nr:SpoIIE family protein phosphatase [Deltaproteobacteria bacterium]
MIGRLTVVSGPSPGAKFTVRDGALIGRTRECAVYLNDQHVSRTHARIAEDSGRLWVEDLGSGNGTFVNDTRVRQRQVLSNGDHIRLRNVVLLYEDLLSFADSRTEMVTMIGPRPDLHLSIIRSVDAVAPALSEDALSDLSVARTIAERLSTVLKVAKAIEGVLDLDQLLPEVVVRILEVFKGADRAVVLFLDEDKNLVPRAMRQRDSELVDGIAVSNTIIAGAIERRKAILTHDAMSDERFEAGLSVSNLRIRAAMCAPLLFRGEALGALYVSSPMLASFNDPDLELLAAVASQVALAVGNAKLHEELLKRQRLDRDLELAERIQKSFLPRRLPELPGFSFGSWYDPAFQIGGDFYDFLELRDGRCGIVIGDVAGKGVSAALYMARLMRDLHAVATSDPDPGHVLERLNATVLDSGQDDLFVTMLYAVLDPKTGHLRFANAGHMPPLIRTGSGVELREAVSGLPLGVMPDTPFGTDGVDLSAGDAILLFTDGLVEAMNDAREMYGMDRLKTTLEGLAGSAQETLDGILKSVSGHVGDAAQFDDTTVVCVGCERARGPKRVRPPVSTAGRR